MTLALFLDQVSQQRAVGECITLPDLPDAVQVLRREKYTGRLVLHFNEGWCTTCEASHPIQIRFDRRAAART